jgi:hypothetical protein
MVDAVASPHCDNPRTGSATRGTSIFDEHNIELSSAADHDQKSRFLTGLHSRFKTDPKATAPTICYVSPAIVAAYMDAGYFRVFSRKSQTG